MKSRTLLQPVRHRLLLCFLVFSASASPKEDIEYFELPAFEKQQVLMSLEREADPERWNNEVESFSSYRMKNFGFEEKNSYIEIVYLPFYDRNNLVKFARGGCMAWEGNWDCGASEVRFVRFSGNLDIVILESEEVWSDAQALKFANKLGEYQTLELQGIRYKIEDFDTIGIGMRSQEENFKLIISDEKTGIASFDVEFAESGLILHQKGSVFTLCPDGEIDYWVPSCSK